MKNNIYNQLNHEPLVWGIPFKYLMINIIFLILSTIVFTKIFHIWVGIPAAFGLNVVIYIILIKFAQTDKIEMFHGRFQRAIKKNIDSLNKSKQVLVLR